MTDINMSKRAPLESTKSVRAENLLLSFKVRICPEYDGGKKFFLWITIKMCHQSAG